MDRAEPESRERRPVLYCLVPAELAAELHEPLRRHFRDRPDTQVVVERRAGERRAQPDRRGVTDAPAARHDRRRIRALHGRRAGERRAALVPVDAPPLPRRLRRHVESLTFAERLEPASERLEDLDTAWVVSAFQAGDGDAFGTLYTRYFDRVYTYMKVGLGSSHDAEDATQQVFLRTLEALPRYERRRQPFRAWLFAIARNHLLSTLSRHGRTELVDPMTLPDRPGSDTAMADEPGLGALAWVADKDLLFLIERLPLAQRQVLMLRYMLDLRVTEIAEVLGMTPNAVSALQHRAFTYLRRRLAAVGREPSRPQRRTPLVRFVRPAQIARSRRSALVH